MSYNDRFSDIESTELRGQQLLQFEVVFNITNNAKEAKDYGAITVYSANELSAVSIAAEQYDTNLSNTVKIKTGEICYAWARQAHLNDDWQSYLVTPKQKTTYIARKNDV